MNSALYILARAGTVNAKMVITYKMAMRQMPVSNDSWALVKVSS